jgi:uncharacterized membrane protein YoaK (UPF0700 family)
MNHNPWSKLRPHIAFTNFYPASEWTNRGHNPITRRITSGIESPFMEKGSKPLPNASKSAVALLLTFVAGSVDVIGFLTLHHVFTAHVTGATAHLGIDLASHQWTEAAIAASVIAAFVFGSVAGRVVIEIAAHARFRRIASVTLAIEASLLVLFVIETGSSHVPNKADSVTAMCLLLGALGCAMGVQTATLTRIGPLTIHTTFVTGMLNKFAQLLSHLLFQTYELRRASRDRERHLRRLRSESASQAMFVGSIWCLYCSGAVAGAFLEKRFGQAALYTGVILLGGAIVVDCIRPLALEEERDQSER